MNLGQFLGLVEFYIKFISFFWDVTVCLKKMLRKGAAFKWNEKFGNAFKLLKAEHAQMPALQYPDLNKPTKLFTDVSKHSYSEILHQEKEGQADANKPELIPTTYFSGTFNKTQKLCNITQTECYAVYKSVKKICFLSYRYRLHIILQPQISNPFLYYRNV